MKTRKVPEPEPESWVARRGRAEEMCARLREHPNDESAQKAIAGFAADPKWEVRKVIAEALAGFPDDLYQTLTSTLNTDQNALVRAAAKRSLERRTSNAGFASGAQPAVQKSLDQIESKFGHEAALVARRFAEKYVELHLKSVVHDMKNVMSYLILDIDSIVSVANASIRARIKRAEKGHLFLEHLIEMMQAYSEDLSLTLRSENMSEIAKEAALSAREQVLRLTPQAEVVAVNFHIPGELLASVSRYHLTMVLTNLIKNGIEAHALSPKAYQPGTVTVRANREGEWIVIEVADTGRGIDPSDLAKLQEFIPGGSAKQSSGSSGYGLPICRRYVEAHHGTLRIESKPDQGTQVTIRIPDFSNNES